MIKLQGFYRRNLGRNETEWLYRDQFLPLLTVLTTLSFHLRKEVFLALTSSSLFIIAGAPKTDKKRESREEAI